MLCLTETTKKMILIINSFIIGYNDRRRHNDNETTTYDAQDTNGNSIFKFILKSCFSYPKILPHL